MKDNAFFEQMTQTACAFDEKHEAHKALKQRIIDTQGWDSPELAAWYEKEKQMKFPYRQGAWKAYSAWRNSTTGEILFNDFVWEREAHDFIDTFRKAGIETFLFTNRSTALMENLHWFAAEGCTLLGLCTINNKGNRWSEERIMGIRFKVN